MKLFGKTLLFHWPIGWEYKYDIYGLGRQWSDLRPYWRGFYTLYTAPRVIIRETDWSTHELPSRSFSGIVGMPGQDPKPILVCSKDQFNDNFYQNGNNHNY